MQYCGFYFDADPEPDPNSNPSFHFSGFEYCEVGSPLISKSFLLGSVLIILNMTCFYFKYYVSIPPGTVLRGSGSDTPECDLFYEKCNLNPVWLCCRAAAKAAGVPVESSGDVEAVKAEP